MQLGAGSYAAWVSDVASSTAKGRFAGKVALVTGGGWNIGRAVAERLAREGARVVLAARRLERLEAAAAAIRAAGGEALAVAADVTVADDLVRCVQRAEAAFGPIGVCAAIAGGSGAHQPIDQVDPGEWVRVVQNNLFGAFHTVRAVLPGMRRQGTGTLLLCCGGGSWFPMLGEPYTAYASAKAAICRLTDQLAVELWDSGIRVNCLQPGMVWNQDVLAKVVVEEQRTGQVHPQRAQHRPPELAAELAAFLLSADSAPLTGRIASVDETWWRDPAQVQAAAQSLHAYTLRRTGG